MVTLAAGFFGLSNSGILLWSCKLPYFERLIIISELKMIKDLPTRLDAISLHTRTPLPLLYHIMLLYMYTCLLAATLLVVSAAVMTWQCNKGSKPINNIIINSIVAIFYCNLHFRSLVTLIFFNQSGFHTNSDRNRKYKFGATNQPTNQPENPFL